MSSSRSSTHGCTNNSLLFSSTCDTIRLHRVMAWGPLPFSGALSHRGHTPLSPALNPATARRTPDRARSVPFLPPLVFWATFLVLCGQSLSCFRR